MADKTISDLVEATRIQSIDLFVLEQSGEAKKLSGQTLLDFVALDVVSATVTTLPEGSNATVVYDRTSKTLAFGIPRGNTGTPGAKGDPGAANKLTIGTVESGDTPSATITGESPNQILNLVLQRGEHGAPAPTITDISIRQTDYHMLISLSDGTSFDAGYCRGASGAGTGDMQEADYDPNGSVKGAGGIVAYLVGTVQPRITANGILKGDGNGGVSTATKNVDYLGVPTGGSTGQVLKKTATGTQWADESGAVTSVNGHTGAVSVNEVSSGGTTGQVLTKTASGYDWQAPSGGMTEEQVNAKINRTTPVNAADTNYTTYMARGEALFPSDTNPTINGTIAWMYE